MKKDELIEALKMLARGRIDAAETVADLLLPEPKISSFVNIKSRGGEGMGSIEVFEAPFPRPSVLEQKKGK